MIEVLQQLVNVKLSGLHDGHRVFLTRIKGLTVHLTHRHVWSVAEGADSLVVLLNLGVQA